MMQSGMRVEIKRSFARDGFFKMGNGWLENADIFVDDIFRCLWQMEVWILRIMQISKIEGIFGKNKGPHGFFIFFKIYFCTWNFCMFYVTWKKSLIIIIVNSKINVLTFKTLQFTSMATPGHDTSVNLQCYFDSTQELSESVTQRISLLE